MAGWIVLFLFTSMMVNILLQVKLRNTKQTFLPHEPSANIYLEWAADIIDKLDVEGEIFKYIEQIKQHLREIMQNEYNRLNEPGKNWHLNSYIFMNKATHTPDKDWKNQAFINNFISPRRHQIAAYVKIWSLPYIGRKQALLYTGKILSITQ